MNASTPAASQATELAIERTHFAADRTVWAAERTLMAWIRTALAMIGFGFTLGKLGQALKLGEFKGLLGLATFSFSGLSYFLVFLGTASLVMAAVQFHYRVRALGRPDLRAARNGTLWVALVLAALGLFAFGALALRF